jgi:hypothetical protein
MVLAASGPVETVGGVWAGFLLHAKAEDKTVPLYIEAGMSGRKLQERSVGETALSVLMYSATAVVIMNLAYTARMHPEKSCYEPMPP